MNTIAPDYLVPFVKKTVQERKGKIENSAQNKITVIKELKDVILASNQISSTYIFSHFKAEKGKGVFQLKDSSKRKRSFAQIQDDV